MLFAAFVFIVGFGAVVGGYAAVTYLPGYLAQRRMNQRLMDLSNPVESEGGDASIVVRPKDGTLPVLERLVSQLGAGNWLKRTIEQSGVKTTPGAIVLMALVLGLVVGLFADIFVRQAMLTPLAAAIGAALPFLFLIRARNKRMKKFEEQFPEALDLLSRALRAGHAFQTAMGMVGDELKDPVGPEFKRTFDQQNFGLPLKDALHQLSERVPILDVRFFVTAVLIQRETGGNMSEILDNLAHVVRERFKILRQVRTHTAHGRFTALVLLSLPPFLAAALTFIAPDHMELLFRHRMGQMMLLVAIIMQTIGFLWIRKVIKIEV
jgi:tight adherence protein B